MIRQKFHKQVIDILDSHSRFESHDFGIRPTKENRVNGKITLVITYLHNSSYHFRLELPTIETQQKDEYRASYKFKGTMSPGRISLKESFTFNNLEPLNEHIRTWLDSIWEEITSSPVISEIDNQRKELDELYKHLDSVSDDFFSKDEAKELEKRLDKLEKQFKKELDKEIKDKNELKNEISTLQKDIETLKMTLESFGKKGWMKTFFGKVFKWVKNPNNQNALKQGYTIVREVLPEEYKGMLPEAKD